jgi:hypothetical protein
MTKASERDSVLLRMLKTPPAPRKPLGKQSKGDVAPKKHERGEVPIQEESKTWPTRLGRAIRARPGSRVSDPANDD